MLRLLCIFIDLGSNFLDTTCYNRNEVSFAYYCSDRIPPPLDVPDINSGYLILVSNPNDKILFQGYYRDKIVIFDPDRDAPHAAIFNVSSEFANGFEPLPTNCRLENF